MSILDTIDLIRGLARSHLTLLIVIALIAIIFACAVTFSKDFRHGFNTLSRPVKAFLSTFTTLVVIVSLFVGIPAVTNPIYEPVISNNVEQNLTCEVSSSQRIASLACRYTDSQKSQIEVQITLEDGGNIYNTLIAGYSDGRFTREMIKEAIETYPAIWKEEISAPAEPELTSTNYFSPDEFAGGNVYVLLLHLNQNFEVEAYSIVTIQS